MIPSRKGLAGLLLPRARLGEDGGAARPGCLHPMDDLLVRNEYWVVGWLLLARFTPFRFCCLSSDHVA